jgi:2-isopropylmalate synthase
VSDGNGPVDALSGALKRALIPSYPYIKDVELVDYKVRILDPQSATAAATRVVSGDVKTLLLNKSIIISYSL